MATVTIDMQDLASRLTEALDLARSGTEVVVQDANGPVVKLVQATQPAKRDFIFNMHPGAMVMREDFDDYIDEEEFLRGDI